MCAPSAPYLIKQVVCAPGRMRVFNVCPPLAFHHTSFTPPLVPGPCHNQLIPSCWIHPLLSLQGGESVFASCKLIVPSPRFPWWAGIVIAVGVLCLCCCCCCFCLCAVLKRRRRYKEQDLEVTIGA